MRPAGDDVSFCADDFAFAPESESPFGSPRCALSFVGIDMVASCCSATLRMPGSVARAGTIVAVANRCLLHILDQGRCGERRAKALRVICKRAHPDISLIDDIWCARCPRGEVHALRLCVEQPLQSRPIAHSRVLVARTLRANGLQPRTHRRYARTGFNARATKDLGTRVRGTSSSNHSRTSLSRPMPCM